MVQFSGKPDEVAEKLGMATAKLRSLSVLGSQGNGVLRLSMCMTGFIGLKSD
jgi:hypothetical protein